MRCHEERRCQLHEKSEYQLSQAIACTEAHSHFGPQCHSGLSFARIVALLSYLGSSNTVFMGQSSEDLLHRNDTAIISRSVGNRRYIIQLQLASQVSHSHTFQDCVTVLGIMVGDLRISGYVRTKWSAWDYHKTLSNNGECISPRREAPE